MHPEIEAQPVAFTHKSEAIQTATDHVPICMLCLDHSYNDTAFRTTVFTTVCRVDHILDLHGCLCLVAYKLQVGVALNIESFTSQQLTRTSFSVIPKIYSGNRYNNFRLLAGDAQQTNSVVVESECSCICGKPERGTKCTNPTQTQSFSHGY